MIFYGTRAKSIRTGQIINADCPSCEKNTSMTYSVFGKYAHIYWIPFFPMSKITIAECDSCAKSYEFIDLPDSIKTKFQRIKEQNPVRYPIWMFSLVFILLGLAAFAFIEGKVSESNTAEYVKQPKAGDVYYFNSDGHYTTARIDKVTRTQAFVTFNDYEVDLESHIDEIDIAKNYTTQHDTLTIYRIQELFNQKTLIEIKRN